MSTSQVPDVVELTRLLVRADTVNPPGHEGRCVEPLADLLADAGFDCHRAEYAPGRPSLIARLAGRPGGGAPLAFTGHVDVVPLGSAAWQHDPFGAEIVDGRLYGRGASDMKGGVAAFVVAAIAMAAAAREAGGLVLVITAGEETGCEGAFHLAREAEGRALLGTAGALVVAEPTGNLPWLGHKGALWLRARATGRTAHGSMPERGDNAIYKIARAATALQGFDFDEPPHELMGSPTLNVGTIAGGLNINSVPDAAEMGVDVRSVAGQDHAALLRCLCGLLGPQVGLTPLMDVPPVYTAPQDPWMQRALAIVQQHSGQSAAPGVASYFSDAAALRPAMGMPPTLILGPGEPSMAHQTDEYCEVARLRAAQALYQSLIEAGCGPSPAGR